MTQGPKTDTFAEELSGELIRPDNPGFDEARSVWNGMIDRRPALIARCKGSADVVASVRFARENDLEISVRGGGHSVAGHAVCENGLMIDMTAMKDVSVDPDAKTARVGPGATWGDFDGEAQKFGLATTGGFDSRTGIAGLTLGGGLGYLARRCGLACDNVLAFDLVTADGEQIRASEDENPDLYWALRGGGGNFGVVTSFTYRLHEVGPEVMTGQIFFRYEDTGDVLRFYRDLMADALDEFTCYPLIVNAPPTEPFPEEAQGKAAIALVVCYTGSISDGEKALAPLESFGDPMLRVIAPMPYAALQSNFNDGFPDGARYYWKSQFLTELSDGAIDVIAEHGSPLPGPFTGVVLEPMGGAVNRKDASATAFPHRDAALSFAIAAGWESPDADEDCIAWTRAFHEAMTPHGTDRTYVNYLDRDESGKVEAAWGGNLKRLQEVKTKYDPDNVFHLNTNIAPKT